MISPKLADAIKDLRHLLDRGFPRTPAVEFISNHYTLELEQRHLIARCIFSEREISDHRARAVGLTGVRGKRLGVDGYNVLITVESILSKKQVIKCDDGFLRDLRALFGKYRPSGVTNRALTEILRAVKRAKPVRGR